MEVRAVARYVRISPQKARLVVDPVRGKVVGEALATLSLTRKKAAKAVINVVRSALSNAREMPDVDESILFIKRIFVDQGPSLKRFRARAQGRAANVKKRTSHITVVLDEML